MLFTETMGGASCEQHPQSNLQQFIKTTTPDGAVNSSTCSPFETESHVCAVSMLRT